MTSANSRRSRRGTLAIAAASALFAIVGGAVLVPATPAESADVMMTREALYKDIEATIGGVPTFVRQLPTAMAPGAWQLQKDLGFSDKTALTPKVKALISLAVSSQIPCSYCIWADTNDARRAGASEEEIGEAVAMAGLTRLWSTMFNGLQVDFETFKKELGGEVAAK